MRVHLIREETLSGFAVANAASRASLTMWLAVLKKADWDNPADIQETFPSADLLGDGSERVVFDIGGNKYRMICKYLFGTVRVQLYIKWIGTHAEYTKLCKVGKQYTVSDY